jgi:hypothetical protein
MPTEGPVPGSQIAVFLTWQKEENIGKVFSFSLSLSLSLSLSVSIYLSLLSCSVLGFNQQKSKKNSKLYSMKTHIHTHICVICILFIYVYNDMIIIKEICQTEQYMLNVYTSRERYRKMVRVD